jgi:hypothetical protein
MTTRSQNVAGQTSAKRAPASRRRWLALAPLLICAALVASPQTGSAAEQAGRVLWAQRPSPGLIGHLYPQRALHQGVSGVVQLYCVVLADLKAQCAIASEAPQGYGFAEAALEASQSYRAQPTLSDGTSAVGARVHVAVAFYPGSR